MNLVLLVGLSLLGLAAALLVRAAFAPRLRATGTLAQIDAYGFGAADAGPEEQVGAVEGLAGVLGNALARRLSRFSEAEVRRELVAAGFYDLEPKRFLGYQALSALATPFVLGGLAVLTGSSAARTVLAVLVGAVGGWVVPRFVVRRKGRDRLQRIDEELPELIDLLVVTVEAGTGFVGSMRIASERLEGPLAQELRLTLQEQTMGLSGVEALRNMGERAPTPGVRTFVRAIAQGETLGVSMGAIMRNLATEMRKRRLASATERAQKAPVKLLFPLIILIFPAMFVVLLGPATFSLIESFGGG